MSGNTTGYAEARDVSALLNLAKRPNLLRSSSSSLSPYSSPINAYSYHPSNERDIQAYDTSKEVREREEEARNIYGYIESLGAESERESEKEREKNKISKTSERVAVQLEETSSNSSIRDWNGEFQYLYEMPSTTPYEREQREREVSALLNDFSSFSLRVAETIVSEQYLPVSDRSIPPMNIGGIAGGEKFVFGNVLFKVGLSLSLSLSLSLFCFISLSVSACLSLSLHVSLCLHLSLCLSLSLNQPLSPSLTPPLSFIPPLSLSSLPVISTVSMVPTHQPRRVLVMKCTVWKPS